MNETNKNDLPLIQKKVNACFTANFGRTPLKQRMDDIFGEAIEQNRFSDMKNLKEETGDLLSSVLQLCNENEWNHKELILATLKKIEGRALQYKSLGRKRKIAILGGAYNPITIGHIKLAQFVLDSSNMFDEIFLTPCFKHMNNKNMVSPEHRLNMCKLAAEVDGRIRVFDYEIKNELEGSTYNMIKRLLDEDFSKQEMDFSLIIGLDNANTFDKWVESDLLEKLIRFVVVPRKGVKRDEKVDWYLKPPHIFLSPDNNIPEISSTEIRTYMDNYYVRPISKNMLPMQYEAEDFVVNSVGRKVFDYIVGNNLYRNEEKDG